MNIISETAKLIPRVFNLIRNGETIKLEDPNSSFSEQEVRELYANSYPELLNANIVEKGIVDGALVYEFSSIAGTKG